MEKPKLTGWKIPETWPSFYAHYFDAELPILLIPQACDLWHLPVPRFLCVRQIVTSCRKHFECSICGEDEIQTDLFIFHDRNPLEHYVVGIDLDDPRGHQQGLTLAEGLILFMLAWSRDECFFPGPLLCPASQYVDGGIPLIQPKKHSLHVRWTHPEDAQQYPSFKSYHINALAYV